ncbi:MAG: hypothetical protein ACJA2M_001299 [Polaribacter sp.]|jgi:hypothetical protein
MPIQIDLGDVVALLALGVSAYSMKKTSDFNKRQNEFIETNDKLNKLLLEKESTELMHKNKADISVNFIKTGKNNHRLKVFNKGNNTARNVRMEFPEGNSILHSSDLDSKLPIPILEQHQSVELLAIVGLGSDSRMTIKLIWDDDFDSNNEKILMPTV